MRHTIKGLVAAFAVMTAGSAPAMACGGGGCCATAHPCATTYAPAYTYTYNYGGCGTCGAYAGYIYERLAEPTTQYYYVNQGPTFSGPGAFAPYPTYQENAIPYRWHRHYYHRPLHYGYRTGYPVRRYY